MLIEQRGFMYLLSYCCTTNYNKLLKNYIDFAMSTGNVAPTDLYIDDVLQEIDFKKIDNYLHNFIKDYRSSYFNQSFKDYNILNLYDMPPVYYQELSNYNINGKTVTEKVFNKMLLEENYKSLKSLWLKLYAKEDINDREIEIMIALTKLLQSKIPLTP
jgi:predicted ATPase